jgi:hypothetical protein
MSLVDELSDAGAQGDVSVGQHGGVVPGLDQMQMFDEAIVVRRFLEISAGSSRQNI